MHSVREVIGKRESSQVIQVGGGTENTGVVLAGKACFPRGDQKGTFEMRPTHQVADNQPRARRKVAQTGGAKGLGEWGGCHRWEWLMCGVPEGRTGPRGQKAGIA